MIDLNASANAQARGWGPGWPRNNSANIVAITWSNGVSPTGGVHRRIATLVELLGNETIRRGYLPHKGWCWGFEDRAIAGTNVASNHSWGLAVDINAPANPYTRPLHTDMPAWMPYMWGEYGFRWGGHYSGPFDAMHYEFMGTPADAAERTTAAMDAFGPQQPNKPQPPTPQPPAARKKPAMFLFLHTFPGRPSAYYLSDGISTYRWVQTSGDKTKLDAAFPTISAPSWVDTLTLVGPPAS